MNVSKGFIFSLLTSLCWAFSIVMARIVLSSGENPYNLAFWTMILATPYWLYIFSGEKQHVKRLTKNDILLVLAMALISSLGVSFAEVFALKYSQAANFSFLIRTVSVFVIVFAAIFLHEKITRKKIVLLVTILAGAYFLTTGGGKLQLSPGDLFTLLEAILIAFGVGVLTKLVTNRMRPNLGASLKFLFALFPLIIISATQTTIRIPHYPLLVVGITIFDFALTTFQFRAFQYASASFITMIMSFTPVFVSLMAIPLLGESLSPTEILGGGLIVVAGILAEKLKI